METRANRYEPLEYDGNRLKAFYRRATSKSNLSRQYSPDRDEVNLSAFADAMIGFYLDEPVEVRGHIEGNLAARLSQVAFAIDYLKGVPYEELDQRIHDNPIAERKGVRDYALGVAGGGARYFRTKVKFEERSGVDISRQFELRHVSVDEFIDLDDTIKRLFHDNCISPGMAQSLLLLFHCRESDAPDELQLRMTRDITQDLERRLRVMTEVLPHKGDGLADLTFAKGAKYIEAALQTTLSSTTLRDLTALEAGEDKDPVRYYHHREQVFGHIGYVLDRVYRRNQ